MTQVRLRPVASTLCFKIKAENLEPDEFMSPSLVFLYIIYIFTILHLPDLSKCAFMLKGMYVSLCIYLFHKHVHTSCGALLRLMSDYFDVFQRLSIEDGLTDRLEQSNVAPSYSLFALEASGRWSEQSFVLAWSFAR